MAREVVVEYETVEREEEVVWCDVCSDKCTDNHAYIMKEVCNSCADEWNRSGGFVSGMQDYMEKKIASLNGAKDGHKKFTNVYDGMDAIFLPFFIPMFIPLMILDGDFKDALFFILNYLIGGLLLFILIGILVSAGLL